ncbi:MAG TPA: RNA polymerase sigma factor [Solirubrobacter sp.]|nr:RNA polymerase sigma factor [Solirubrobacter sp.]
MAAAAAGDDAAFAEFYRRHVSLVVGYLRKRVDEPETAFDLAAETFAAALVGLHRYRRGRGPASAWLLGIARNKFRESRRRGRVAAGARLRLGFEPIAVDDLDLVAVEERAEEGMSQLEHLLTQLPAEQGRAVRARIIEQREYAEIAREIQCSPQVVRQRVSRGLRALRARLEQE